MMEPILPDPAERPAEVDLYRVGKHSPGTMNVVALGPHAYVSDLQRGKVQTLLTKVEKEVANAVDTKHRF